ncbi:MAG: hypothetical protein WCP55_24370 [Lentisphaerota bacterium]
MFNETVRPLKHPDDFFIHPLADGVERWREYFKAVKVPDATILHCWNSSKTTRPNRSLRMEKH